ncbi:MAG: acylphosphatase [Betaproteobacteria bacterium]|nr:MAG: acylphosphatase [Betaproteobacteria bacterium]
MDVTLHLSIAGRVQGVGYRESLRAEALRLGVSGWVRNRRDGSVEAVLQGPHEAVDAALAWARRGPPAARVAQLDARPATGEFDRPYAGFERLPSA